MDLELRFSEGSGLRTGLPEEIRITVEGREEPVTVSYAPSARVRIPVEAPRLWSPEHPELYSTHFTELGSIVSAACRNSRSLVSCSST